MEVRSYYATTVEAAVELAREELGPETMLIHSRRTTPDTAHLGRYEVVFAIDTPLARPQRPQPPDPDEICNLAPVDLIGKLDFTSVLRAVGVPSLESPLEEAGIACSPGLGRPGVSVDIVALVGPCGAGKSTVLMKLALAHGLAASRPVRILAFDPYRVGANCQLRHFAHVLSLEFDEFETVTELRAAMAQPRHGLTLIDTPGYSHTSQEELNELAGALRDHPRIETQLVLRIDRKTAANLDAIRRFSVFEPARLIFTALDETTDRAGVAELAERASIPVSFLSTGQNIEDLEPASASRLARLTHDDTRAARAAA